MPRILLVPIEFSTWHQARAWSYTGGYAFYDGMLENGIQCEMAPVIIDKTGALDTRFVDYIRQHNLAKYDQVWVWCVHANYPEQLWDYFKSITDVRVGVLMESLHFTPAEIIEFPHLQQREALVHQQLQHCTHALSCCAKDADNIEKALGIPATWYPAMVPEQFVLFDNAPAGTHAAFVGNCYGERKQYLKEGRLDHLLCRPEHPERSTSLPDDFDTLMTNLPSQFSSETDYSRHLAALVELRKALFTVHLQGMRQGLCNVNLPSILKAYAGRVIESMAAAVPVMSWIPAGEEQRNLFDSAQDLAFFNSVDDFATQFEMLRADEQRRELMVITARNKLLVRHTSRIRTHQLLQWVSKAQAPTYNVDLGYRPTAEETVYYKKFFTEQRGWSQREPNSDERSRWDVIYRYIKDTAQADRTRQIVEVGCGRGWLSNLLSEFGAVTAVDPVGDVIHAAKQNFPQVNFLTGSADLLVEIGHGQKYDLLVCSEVIEHVPNPFKHSFASALVKLVQANGYLVLSTPRKDILEEWTQKYGVPGQPTEDWVTEQELADLFVANGCEVVALNRAFLLDIYQIYLFRKLA